MQNSIGVLYRKIGDNKKALDVLIESVEIAEKNQINNSTAYNNIAVIFISQSNFIKALEYYKLAIKIEEKTIPSNKKK